jgi:hypothetical protein
MVQWRIGKKVILTQNSGGNNAALTPANQPEIGSSIILRSTACGDIGNGAIFDPYANLNDEYHPGYIDYADYCPELGEEVPLDGPIVEPDTHDGCLEQLVMNHMYDPDDITLGWVGGDYYFVNLKGDHYPGETYNLQFTPSSDGDGEDVAIPPRHYHGIYDDVIARDELGNGGVTLYPGLNKPVLIMDVSVGEEGPYRDRKILPQTCFSCMNYSKKVLVPRTLMTVPDETVPIDYPAHWACPSEPGDYHHLDGSWTPHDHLWDFYYGNPDHITPPRIPISEHGAWQACCAGGADDCMDMSGNPGSNYTSYGCDKFQFWYPYGAIWIWMHLKGVGDPWCATMGGAIGSNSTGECPSIYPGEGWVDVSCQPYSMINMPQINCAPTFNEFGDVVAHSGEFVNSNWTDENGEYVDITGKQLYDPTNILSAEDSKTLTDPATIEATPTDPLTGEYSVSTGEGDIQVTMGGEDMGTATPEQSISFVGNGGMIVLSPTTVAKYAQIEKGGKATAWKEGFTHHTTVNSYTEERTVKTRYRWGTWGSSNQTEAFKIDALMLYIGGTSMCGWAAPTWGAWWSRPKTKLKSLSFCYPSQWDLEGFYDLTDQEKTIPGMESSSDAPETSDDKMKDLSKHARRDMLLRRQKEGIS